MGGFFWFVWMGVDGILSLVVAFIAAWLIFKGAGIIWQKADIGILRIIIVVLWFAAFPAMLGISILVGIFGQPEPDGRSSRNNRQDSA